MEGKSVVPMEIAFMDTEDEHKKYGTLRLLRYIYIQLYLGFQFLPWACLIFLLEKLRGSVGKIHRQCSSINQAESRIVTHNKILCIYRDILNFCILPFTYISTPNPLFYWSV
jgi:hypothetical protein